MMAGLRDCPPTVQFSPSFMLCHTSAQEISQIIAKVAITNPCFHYFSPFVGFCVFQSGLIHVMASQVSTDAAVVSTAQRNVGNHATALQGIAKFWFMAGRLHAVLKNLIESARQPVGQGMSWIILKEKMDASMSEDTMEARPEGSNVGLPDVMSPSNGGPNERTTMPPLMQPPIGQRGDGTGLDYPMFSEGEHPGPGQAHYTQRAGPPSTSQPSYGTPPQQYPATSQTYRPPIYGNPAQPYEQYSASNQNSIPPPYPPGVHSRQLPVPHSQQSGQSSGAKPGSGMPMGMASDAPSPMGMGKWSRTGLRRFN